MHRPVLVNEVLEYLKPCPNENFIDCTFGFGGHSRALLEKNKPRGRVLGIEEEKEILKIVQQKQTEKRLLLVLDNFVNLKSIVRKNNFFPVSGILFDLGLCSWQLESSGRGFSFKKDEPLLMNRSGRGLTAKEIVNNWSQKELARIFKEYGDERRATAIARLICQSRKEQKIQTTGQLVEIVRRATGGRRRKRGIHFATLVFQALRIAVNNELENLESVLPQALEILEPGGRIAVISFHSKEDRIVKNFFRDSKRNGLVQILTKKPIRPGPEEIGLNPRSRSARLRAAAKQQTDL